MTIYYTSHSFIPSSALTDNTGLEFIGMVDRVRYTGLKLGHTVTTRDEVTLTLSRDGDYSRVKIPAGSRLTLLRIGNAATAAAIQVE